ncbi:DUF4180 domain-containing protein [Isosphaeraceae bacterium EP7]
MELVTLEDGGLTIEEGQPGEAFITGPGDVDLIIEACFASGARAALLYAENLPVGLFDLSSCQAGSILQKLRQYRIRLAVVGGFERFSSRFGEMVAEESKGSDFRVFETREAAREWLLG